jgi:hypothetical protein
MKTFRNITWGALAFGVVATIAGQILMHGQGDTPEISARYGLLYVFYGCGIPEMLDMIPSGEFHLSLILFEVLAGFGVFWVLQRKRKGY